MSTDGTGLFASHHQGVHFFHLSKCGGTTLNAWLDTLVDDHLAWDPHRWAGVFTDEPRDWRRHAVVADASAPIVHGHPAFGLYFGPGRLRFTVLREPVARLRSQIADWRRLTDGDLAAVPPDRAAAMRDTRHLPPEAYLERHAAGAAIDMLDNHMVRLIAAHRAGPAVLGLPDAAPLLDLALTALRQDFDLVGLTEAQDLTRNAVSAALGLPPVGAWARRNVLGAGADPAPPDGPAMVACTRLDAVLFAEATRLFEEHAAPLARAWTVEAFEAAAATRLFAGRRGSAEGAAVYWTVREALFGTGMHGRDAPLRPDCAVWSGPDRTLRLYLPAPAGEPIELLLWVRGFAAPHQREALTIRVDEVLQPWRSEPAPGYAECLVAGPVTPRRNFVRLEFEAGAPEATGTPDDPGHDPRRRAICFDRYGWRPV